MRNVYNFLLYEYYSLQLGALYKYRLHKGGSPSENGCEDGGGGLDPENVHI